MGGRPAAGVDIPTLVERAFHYRGDVTVRTADGGMVTGFLFNRNAQRDPPFVQLLETRTARVVSLPYRSITEVLFTGRDAARTSLMRFEAAQDR